MPPTPKRALITGITGQDGSYLAELLLEKGYEVHGMVRRASLFNRSRIEPLTDDPANAGRLFLHYGDVTDASNVAAMVTKILPDEIYNLAAQSHVAVSFETPEHTAQTDAVGPLRLLEAIRSVADRKAIRFYQASTSEMFGKVAESPQRETTPFNPQSPYGAAKLYAHWITVNYREAYGLFACSGILFNHESERRGENFVTRKITLTLARIAAGEPVVLSLGNLDAKRDWGHALDYVRGMWLMLQRDEPTDYVLATGEQRSVRQFVEAAFAAAGVGLVWQGKGRDEVGVDPATGALRVNVDPRHFRPAEVDTLVGDATRARSELGWTPTVGFDELVRRMVKSDLRAKGVGLHD
ncbi:MAG: GDP-mannose 4,6-dehydratase [Nitrospinae bacterium]|nr:GDP-mannose 4,6-dehydratase [Nitrospinota bacterium]